MTKSATFPLRDPYIITSFVSPDSYKEFNRFLIHKQRDPKGVSIADYSGYGTIFGHLLAHYENIVFIGDKYDFILSGKNYCHFLKGHQNTIKWMNYTTERYEFNTDVESAASAITAMEYIGTSAFEYCVIYKKIKSLMNEEA